MEVKSFSLFPATIPSLEINNKELISVVLKIILWKDYSIFNEALFMRERIEIKFHSIELDCKNYPIDYY